MKLPKKTYHWAIAIIATLGIFSLSFTPVWLGTLTLIAVCYLAFGSRK